MKNIILQLFAIALIGLSACNTAQNGRISGVISNGDQKEIILNKIQGKNAIGIEKVPLGANGDFYFDIKDLEPGVYSLQVENRVVLFALDGTEKAISLEGDYNTISNADYNISGSTASAELQEIMQKIMSRQMKPQDYKELANQGKNALVVGMITQNYLPMTKNNLPAHKLAQEKLAAAYPNAQLTANYNQSITQAEASFNRKRVEAPSPVLVGQMAPDIDLPDPSGKNRKLSALRGNVVVLDFWASWCGPCRRFGNPELVKLYDKHKKDDFAIYNVALERSSKNDRWIAAIEKDKLVWPDQVIDRSREYSVQYGVRGIPRTFVLDKDGRIAAINPHGAELEEAVEELLNKG